ncbi:hypothetical protein BGW80DRAFT_1322100 [Lactifluus volemus]|nr:hypothetical protein BGW80DRAFT_1322100 [Lactifluus volemus]
MSLRSDPYYNEPRDRQAGTLVMTERWWRDHYNAISELGYKLRPRYHPQWQPSWVNLGKDFFSVEDGQPSILRAAMDATSTLDDRPVMLKKVLVAEGPHELAISQLFSSPELAMEPHNHCAPLLDVIELQSPEHQKLMMQTFGEFVAFFAQISIPGLKVICSDCTANNIMFDPSGMYPNGFHPIRTDRNRNFKGAAKAYTRTQRPPVYYFIDFGLSRQYASRSVMDSPLRGGDKSAPEHRSGMRCNPFHTDIYYIGNLKYRGFEFMEDLVNSMTQRDPASRPLIEEVLERFGSIRQSLRMAKLRSTIISRKAPMVFGVMKRATRSVRTVKYIVSGRPAIPDPYVQVIPRRSSLSTSKCGCRRLLRILVTCSKSSVASLGRAINQRVL